MTRQVSKRILCPGLNKVAVYPKVEVVFDGLVGCHIHWRQLRTAPQLGEDNPNEDVMRIPIRMHIHQFRGEVCIDR